MAAAAHVHVLSSSSSSSSSSLPKFRISASSAPPKPKKSSITLIAPPPLRTSFLGLPSVLSLRPIIPLSRAHSSSTSVSSILPTAKPDRAPADKIPKWSMKGIKSFGMSELEARKLKYPTTGTEALLMGILVEGTSEASKFLRANGITLFKVRDETVKLLGKSDMYFFSPEHPPLTEPAQRALDFAIDEKMKSGESGEVTATHILLGIWSEENSAGHKILATLGFDNDKASELAKTADKEAAMNYW